MGDYWQNMDVGLLFRIVYFDSYHESIYGTDVGNCNIIPQSNSTRIINIDAMQGMIRMDGAADYINLTPTWIECFLHFVTCYFFYDVQFISIKSMKTTSMETFNTGVLDKKILNDSIRVYDHSSIWYQILQLTHLPLVPHICISELGHHWFR